MERWLEAASSKAGGVMWFQMDDGFVGGWAESAAVAQAADERALLSSSSSRRQARQAARASPFSLATSRSRSSGCCSSRAAARASNGRGGRRGLRTCCGRRRLPRPGGGGRAATLSGRALAGSAQRQVLDARVAAAWRRRHAGPAAVGVVGGARGVDDRGDWRGAGAARRRAEEKMDSLPLAPAKLRHSTPLAWPAPALRTHPCLTALHHIDTQTQQRASVI